jgi:hypothetical protein
MLCPWCMHYGAEDDEYVFDDDLYCGICAQQLPESDDTWAAAFRAMTPEMLTAVEQELNRIAVSKSGLRADLLTAMGEGIAALAALRHARPGERSLPEEEYVRWVRFACSYYAPQLR